MAVSLQQQMSKFYLLLVLFLQLTLTQIIKKPIPNGQHNALLISPSLGTVTVVWNSAQNSVHVNECNTFSCSLRYPSAGKIRFVQCAYTSLSCPGNKQEPIKALLQSLDSYLVQGTTALFYNSNDRSQLVVLSPYTNPTLPSPYPQVLPPSVPSVLSASIQLSNKQYSARLSSTYLEKYSKVFSINGNQLSFMECNHHTCSISYPSAGKIKIGTCGARTRKGCSDTKEYQVTNLLSTIDTIETSGSNIKLTSSQNKQNQIILA